MGLAFDYFDEFTETLSGKETLHDTMGILYQVKDMSQDKLNYQTHEPSQISLKRKRKFDGLEKPIEPYMKKSRLDHFSYEITNIQSAHNSLHKGNMDFAFLLCLALKVKNILMWVGFNAN